MKRILTSWLLLVVFAAIVSSCKKDDNTNNNGGGTFEAIDYTFNKATRSFEPVEEVTANIIAPGGIRFVYCFLIRDNQTDSLIYVSNNSGENPKNYTLNIPVGSFPSNNMNKVKGVKVLVKQTDNSSIQGFINMNFFDPDLPQLTDFPTEITADLNGGTTAITGNLTSIYGLKQVDIYDDYQTEDTYVLVNSITNIYSAKNYALNYSYTYRKAAQHIKVVATDIYNQTNEVIINMPVDVSIFKPRFVNFASTITPNTSGTTSVSGEITSITGLKRVDIYDDYKGAYVLVGSVENLNGVASYNLNYAYTFRKRAENLKVIAIDTEDLQSELTIPLNVNYGSVVYRDIVMNAHTTGTNTIFFSETGTTKGNCDLVASEATMAFLYYGTGTGPSFYSPTNTSNVASNFRCSGASWVINNPGVLRATRFRVLIPGSSTIDNIYTLLADNGIDDLSDNLFGSTSISGSSAKFDPNATATTSIFNLTTNLIAVRIPNIGATTYKNAIIHVKEATFSTGTSTIKFDIYIQK